MHSRTIVLAVGLLAAPLSMLAVPDRSMGAAITTVAVPLPNTVGGRVLEPAPVPTVDAAGVSPADRVAGAGTRSTGAGPLNSTPFSATPSGTLSDGGDQASQRDRTFAPADGAGATPNLGR